MVEEGAVCRLKRLLGMKIAMFVYGVVGVGRAMCESPIMNFPVTIPKLKHTSLGMPRNNVNE